MSLFSQVVTELKGGRYPDLILDPSEKFATKPITTTEDLILYDEKDCGEWEVSEKNTEKVTTVQNIKGATKLIALEFIGAFKDFKKEAEQNAPIDNLKECGFEFQADTGEEAPEKVEPDVLSDADKLAMLDEIMDGKTEAKKPSLPRVPAKRDTQIKPSVLPAIQTVYNFSEKQLQAIKDTVAKGASDSEFEMLMYLANRYQLDPILKEIFYSPQMKTIMTSRDGYLKIAQRSPDFEGVSSMAVCENDDFELDVPNCSVKHKFGKGDRGKVIGSWAIVYRTGRRPQLAWASTPEYKNNNPAWKYVSAMSCKCSEIFALKRAYSISGLVTQEEMGTEANEITETVPIIDAEYMEVEA